MRPGKGHRGQPTKSGAPRRSGQRDRYVDCAGVVWVKRKRDDKWKPLPPRKPKR